MADNVDITEGSGKTIATDDVGGVQYQRVKLDLGGDGTASPLVAGQQAKAASIPVVVASDQDALPVNIIAGQTGVSAGAGAVAANTPRVTFASDDPVVAAVKAEDAAHASGDKGVMALGVRRDAAASSAGTDGDYATLNLDANGRLYVNGQVEGPAAADAAVSGNPVQMGGRASTAAPTDVSADGDAAPLWVTRKGAAVVDGGIAHDAADSGNPVKTGGVARTSSPTAVASGDRAQFMTDTLGKQVVLPYANPENLVAGATAAVTNTSDTSIIAAAGAGVRNYITALSVINSHASVDTVVEIKSGSTVIWRGYAPHGGGGFTISFPTPLRCGANEALNGACITTGSNTYFCAAGYTAP